MSNRGNMPAMPPNAGWRDNEPGARGLTIREDIAKAAMQGMIGNQSLMDVNSETLDWIAKKAFEQADRMLDRM